MRHKVMAKVNKRVAPMQKTKRDYSKLKTILRYVKLAMKTSILTALLGGIGFYSWQGIQIFLKLPITEIVINSKLHYVDRGKLSLHVKEMIGDSFISKNISHIQAEIQSMAWVDTVNLVRKWPDQLQMTIGEHTPIARWSNIGFVNTRGELILTDNLEKLAILPELNGKKNDVADIMHEYSVLAKILQPYQLKISYLEKNKRGAWRVALDNNWKVTLGRDEVLKKINRLTQLLDQQWLTIASSVDTIDMRYPNGVSVKWSTDNLEKNIEGQVGKNKVSSTDHSKKIELSHAKDMTHTRG
ncbi:hypothetical protein AB835_01270 [Candidatus Endobugula sertula]|uniref:Cell division protein FtsQ n=1 Tax=Candidatus Endobugula sertula TaxID=62101 RepID=A0A1D2QTQ4_9GAMM|nr:hypothetical protein AB835_01270 [Candidatus Endobugula sertula]